MKILVDADACPVKNEIVKTARKLQIEVIFFIDVNHQLKDDYATVITVDQGMDSVDLKLINHMEPGDLVISQDYGVASLALGKGGHVLHPSGRELNGTNIDQLMFERHMSRKMRKQGVRGPRHKKRTKDDNIIFEHALRAKLMTILD